MSTATEETRIWAGGWACTKVRLRDDEEHLNWTDCYARVPPLLWSRGELHITTDRLIWTPFWLGNRVWWARPVVVQRTDIVRVALDERGYPGLSMGAKWTVDTLLKTWTFSFGFFTHTKRQQWIDAINEWAFTE